MSHTMSNFFFVSNKIKEKKLISFCTLMMSDWWGPNVVQTKVIFSYFIHFIHLFVRWNFKILANSSVILLISQVINWFNSFIWHHHSLEENFLEKQKAQQRSLDNKNWLILRVKLNWHSFWCLGLEWMFS